jgi:hypothetical protein
MHSMSALHFPCTLIAVYWLLLPNKIRKRVQIHFLP